MVILIVNDFLGGTTASEEVTEAPSTSGDVPISEFNAGSLSQIVEKAARNFRAETFSLAAHELSQAINQESNMPDDYR
jgi:hypothetical protein